MSAPTNIIEEINPQDLNQSLTDELVTIWQSSVRTSHDFLSEKDIYQIGEDIRGGIKYYPHIVVYRRHQKIVAFMTIYQDKVEMLFVDAAYLRQGIGTALMRWAQDNYHTHKVDVNEQNHQAREFYQHLGFMPIGRDETDDQGRPFPILHLELINHQS